ncbi:phage holin family protein [Georgenia satyanarayanai]|uniref:phage holin family protein n=1 Tax=Georgenia satyanarayanai TaxID=860221 RepID=UPI001264564D|nr:phage holin family protein [Georgenia satyanarayanai]
MVTLLIRGAIFLASAALGLLVASWLLKDTFRLSASGFVVAVVVFAVAQSVLAPFIAKAAARYAPAFLGGIGLVSTFVALLVASLVGGGLTISGAQGWILGAVVVWLVTAVATLVLPMALLRGRTQGTRTDRRAGRPASTG